MADMLLGMYRAARRGDFAAVGSTLETLLGRRPQTMRDVFAGVLDPAASRDAPGNSHACAVPMPQWKAC